MSKIEAPGELIHRVLDEAQASPDDHVWADRVLWLMPMDAEVRPQVVATELRDVAQQIAKTGESAETLYGTAESYAAHRVRELCENGVDAFEDSLIGCGKRDYVQLALIMSAVFAVILSLGLMLLKDDVHIAALTIPVIMGFTGTVMIFVFRHLNIKAGIVKASVAAAAVVAVGTVVQALSLQQLQASLNTRLAPVWFLAVAGVYALLVFIFSKLFPDVKTMERNLQMAEGRQGAGVARPQRSEIYDPNDTTAWEQLFMGSCADRTLSPKKRCRTSPPKYWSTPATLTPIPTLNSVTP